MTGLVASRSVPVTVRSALVLTLASVAGLAVFLWPLLISPRPDAAGHTTDAPLIFVLTLPVLVLVILAEVSSGGIDAKALALLGVLSAVNAALDRKSTRLNSSHYALSRMPSSA